MTREAPTPQPLATPSRPAWAALGRKLGRYRLGPSLGRGGMGEVFEGWDTLLNRTVAVKVLHETHPGALLRFMKEAQLQARVSHPNLCRIYDVDASENVPFIAMQLVQGPSLLQAAHLLDLREAVQILAEVAQAMHAAHRMNLVHRDLKPSNILLERSSAGGWVPYVADFGLAKDLEEEGLTHSRGVLGTPSYMAPEQRRGETAVGPAADVYSLGVTLCTVLALDREGPLPEIPRDLRAILRRCLEDRPGDRYASAAALAEDFRRFLDGEPLLGRRGAWIRALRRAPRRHPALAASLALAVLAALLLSVQEARHSAASRRRTLLALRFAQETRDLENAVALEMLQPPHDMRPVLARMSEGLESMRSDMAHLGPEAAGPGNLALGRGYLAMRFLHAALPALEAAWDSGHRTPDTAMALCKVHLEFHLRLKDLEDMGFRPPGLLGSADHLEAARTFHALAGAGAWEPPDLTLARIRTFEGRPGEGAALARKLREGRPLYHPALVEEAYALAEQGRACQSAGDSAAALERFREAEAAALEARTIARSDLTAYFAAVRWRMARLQAPGLPGPEALRLLAQAEGLMAGALAIRPASPRANATMIRILLDRARTLHRLGRDAEPVLNRAEAFLEHAQSRDAYRWLIPQGRDRLAALRAELGYLS